MQGVKGLNLFDIIGYTNNATEIYRFFTISC